MARSQRERELRDYERSARRERFKQGWKFIGFGAASIWSYPLVVLACSAVFAFTIGLPENARLNEELGREAFDTAVYVYSSMAIGAILGIVGLFRVNGRWYAPFGMALTYFVPPWSAMLWLQPYMAELPGFFENLGTQLFGG